MFTLKFDRSLTALALAGACAGSLTLAGNAQADGADGDLFFYPQGGELIVGRYAFEDPGDGSPFDEGDVIEAVTEQVIIAEFEASWEDGLGDSPGTDEPGVTTDGASPLDDDGISFPFPANTALIANANVLPVLGVDLAYWDATGPTASFAAPDPLDTQSIIIETPFVGGPVSELVFDGDGIAPTGDLVAWQSNGAGTAHAHYEFLSGELNADTEPGIYLLSLTFEAGGFSTEPLYFLFGYADGTTLTDEQLDSALEIAEEYVETVIIPEPASALLLAAAGGLALIRRR